MVRNTCFAHWYLCFGRWCDCKPSINHADRCLGECEPSVDCPLGTCGLHRATTGYSQGSIMPYVGPCLIPISVNTKYLLIGIAFDMDWQPQHMFTSRSRPQAFFVLVRPAFLEKMCFGQKLISSQTFNQYLKIFVKYLSIFVNIPINIW